MMFIVAPELIINFCTVDFNLVSWLFFSNAKDGYILV